MKRSAPEVEYERAGDRVPRSFVFKMGKVGKTVKELVEDVRLLMQPNTASRLQTKSSNTMKGKWRASDRLSRLSQSF